MEPLQSGLHKVTFRNELSVKKIGTFHQLLSLFSRKDQEEITVYDKKVCGFMCKAFGRLAVAMLGLTDYYLYLLFNQHNSSYLEK